MWHLTERHIAALFSPQRDPEANREAVRHLLTGCERCCRSVYGFLHSERAIEQLPHPRRSRTCLDM